MSTRLILLYGALVAAAGLGLGGCARDAAEPERIPRPEHPRPDFERAQWLTLNGSWEFRFDPRDEGVERRWYEPGARFDRSILVPFCWESELSGVQDRDLREIGWYRRRVTAPAEWIGRRVWLRFEAVDWEAVVWLDGEEIGRHEGGYSPFAFDVTEHLAPGETAVLTVRAFDPTSPELPTGKQSPDGFTFVSGVWQSVWLEARPASYLDKLQLVSRPTPEGWELTADFETAGSPARAEIETPGLAPASASRGEDGRYSARLLLPDAVAWTPETPTLYPLEVRVTGADGETDTVRSYFALRTVERGRYRDADAESILLNGKPVYLRGALDASYNASGLYTAPTDEFLRRDLELAKELGFNFLRIHGKADEPRRLYWADRLGLLLMEDVPDCRQRSARCRQAWEETMRAMIERDRNHPSVIAWNLLDQAVDASARPWAAQKWAEAKALDPSRLVEDNASDAHARTDLDAWSFYGEDWEAAREAIETVVAETHVGSQARYAEGHSQAGAPLFPSEYGAVPAGGGDRDVSFGFKHLTNLLRRHKAIQGSVYAGFTDVEQAHNGLLNYDRSPKESGYGAFLRDMRPRDLLGADFVGYLGPPVVEAQPGQRLQLRTFVSHFSDREQPPTLQATLVGVNDLSGDIELLGNPRKVRWERYGVTEQAPIPMTLPNLRNFTGAVTLELLDESGKRIAANYVSIVVRDAERSPRRERVTPRRLALRVDPGDFAALAWEGSAPDAELCRRYGKFWGTGSGRVEYRFDVPREALAAGVEKIELLAELATKSAGEKLDWPSVVHPADYPQTDGKKHPGAVRLTLGGEDLGQVRLSDDPADARGVLSHFQGFHSGSYGELVVLALDPASAFLERLERDPALRLTFEVEDGAGLSIHGERTGRYPIDLTVILSTRDALPADLR